MASPLSSYQATPGTPDPAEVREPDRNGLAAIPPIRWIMVGYFFWVGIFLGALIMHATTAY